MNKEKPVPCKKCGNLPITVKLMDMYYTQCHGRYKTKEYTDKNGLFCPSITKTCDCWDPYEFLGSSRDASIANWNHYNDRPSAKNFWKKIDLNEKEV